MSFEILEGLFEALNLIFSGNPTLYDITTRSILISGTATLLSVVWGAPLAIILGLRKFRGKTIIKSLFNALLGVPTVALGLILYLLLSRSGPLGFLDILYAPIGIIIGQAILITPITVSFITSAIESVDPEIRDLARTLGASETRASISVVEESSSGFLLAIIASFNRAIAELGVALMVGGNIKGITRVLTTTIALETSRGEVVLAIALTIILLSIVIVVSFLINFIQRRRG